MKKKIFFSILIFLLISILIFIKLEYKGNNLGNNINDNTDILNISSYEAEVTVEVHSNKNTNKYIIKQKYAEPNIFSQEIMQPNSMSGIKIILNEGNITLENQKLGLKTLYENFNGDISNLSLISFINEYKSKADKNVTQKEKEVVMETSISNSKNKYQMYQRLYISKDSNLPTKMEILDVNKKVTVYILYNEIRVNQTNKGDIL